MSRRPLTQKEKELANRVRFLWEAKKSRDKVTQADANAALGWTSSVFSQYISGNMAIGLESLVKLAEYLGVSPYEIDPDLAKRFPAPTTEFRNLEAELNTLNASDTKHLLKVLATRLPPAEVASLIELLLDRLKTRL